MLSLLVCAILSANPAQLQAMLDDRDVVKELAEMVILANAMKACEGEQAAFVVRRADRKLAVVHWSTDCSALRKTYRGIIPPNAIAIVHTHPEGRREPSPEDLSEARRIKLPICVLTRRGIWIADPVRTESIALLDDPAWTEQRGVRASR